MTDIASRLAAARVLVVGDIMLDRYWSGPVSRVSPEAPVPVVLVSDTDDRVGGAGNVALNVVAFGAAASILAPVGQDDAAARLAGLLGEAKVQCRLEYLSDYPTTTKLRVVSARQQLLRLDFEDLGADVGSALSAAFALVLNTPDAPDVVLFSDYAKGALSDVCALIPQVRALGKRCIVDPKGQDFSRYRGASILTPNLSEFEAIVGRTSGQADLEARARRLASELELEALLVTQGGEGMTLVPQAGPALRFPTEAREVFDVTGAGDTVCAVLAAMLAADYSLEDAVRYANKAAGVVVGKFGTATASLAEIENLLGQRHDRPQGRVTEEALLLRDLAAARARGERIVFTNGCFDILHAGHVSYLREARGLGDRLVVAVNSDASVSRLKGPGRPINALADRMEVLSELSAVDWVVAFDEDTPARLIEVVLPDVLVKGGDYRPEEVVGGDIVLAAGGQVRCLEFLPGRSTTGILTRQNESAS